MIYRECQLFHFRFFLLSAVCGLLLLFISCGASKDAYLKRGEEFLQKRKFHEAAMQFRAAADIDKDSAGAHWGLARAYENLGQFYETIEELRKTTELAPENLEAKVKLGNYFLLIQPPLIDESEKLLNDIFARDANFIEGHILKASVLAAQNKPEKDVLDVLNYAISLDPNRTASYLSLARFFMKEEKAKEAEDTIKKAISVNERVALGYLEYGRFLTYATRPEEAEAQFNKAIEVEPQSIEAREAIAEFYLAQKQIDKAEKAYRDLVQIQENSPESRIELANFYVQVKREDDAVKILNEILTEMPEYVRARYRLGEIYLEQQENEKAAEQAEALLKLNDKDTEALLLRARLFLQENKAEDAVKDLENILKSQPSHRDALYYMTQARLAMGQIDQARAFIGDLDKYHPNFLKTRVLKIQMAFAGGETESALRQANELVTIAEKNAPNAETSSLDLQELGARGLTARGLAYLELGKLTEAKADLEKVQKNAPNSSAALINLAKVYTAEKNFSGALALYEKAAALDGKNFDALSGAVGVLKKQKNFVLAHAKIDQALQKNAGQADVLPALHYLQADVFLAEKNTESAEAELKKAIELDENYLPAYSAYASLLVERNQTEAAIGQFQKAVEKKPSATVYTLLGMLEEARENLPEAEKHYRKALEIAPDTPIAANNLAWLIAENGQGNLDEALRLAQAAVNQNSNAAGYYDTLGWVYYKKGLYSPAVEQLKKAVLLDEAEARRSGVKPNPGYRLRLGTALASSGDKLSARKEVENSLRDEQILSQKELRDAKSLLANL